MLRNRFRRHRTVRFLQFRFDVSSKRLFDDKTEVLLTQKDRELLRVLIERRYRVVKRDELFENVWAGQDVGDGSLGVAVHHLRQCLGADGQNIVRTVPGVGYQFNAALVATDSRWRWPLGFAIPTLAMVLLFLHTQPPHLPRVLSVRRLTQDMIQKGGGTVLQNSLYFAGDHNSLYRVPLSGGIPVPVLSGVQLAGSANGGLVYCDSAGEVWWWKAETGVRARLGTVADCRLTISPTDGRWAVYSDKDVWLTNEGKLLYHLSKPPGIISDLRWSPSGRKLVASAFDDSLPQSSIWVAEPPKGFQSIITSRLAGQGYVAPQWTTDGRYLIFAVLSGERFSRLWYRRESDGAMGQLTADALDLWNPMIGPRADVIYAIGGTRRLQLVTVEGGHLIPYLSGRPYTYLDFSRDGATLIYSTTPEYSLWAAKADGTGGRRILDGSQLEAHGSHLAPDGKTVAFMGHERSGGYKIYTIPTSGGHPARLTTGTADEGIPTWSADGRLVAYGELRYRKDPSEMAIHMFDTRTKAGSLLPDSAGIWSPRWSPDGSSIAAVSADQKIVKRFDFRNHRWTDLARFADFENPVWTPDGEYIYGDGMRPEDGREIKLFRVRASDGKVDVIADFDTSVKDWLGVTPDGSLLALQIFAPRDIYEITVDWP